MCEGLCVETVARDRNSHINPLKFKSQIQVLKYLGERKFA
jgi:hypothetical protein